MPKGNPFKRRRIVVWLVFAVFVTACAVQPYPIPTPEIILPTPTNLSAAPPLTAAGPTAVGEILSGAGETTVYMRSGPGATYDRVGSLPAGAEVQVTGRSPHGEWWRVSGAGLEGWVFSSYVSVQGDAQTVPCVADAAGACQTAEPSPGNDRAVASIRAMSGDMDLPVSFLQMEDNPNADLRKSLVYTDAEGGEYWVDQQTMQVVQWTAGQTGISGEAKAIDALRTLAETFALRQSPVFRRSSGLLTRTETTKDGEQYAFRWEDRTLTGHVLFPFLQVVVRADGQILGYHNTLDVFVK